MYVDIKKNVRNQMNDKHGNIAEDSIEKISYRLFGADLVLRSPILIEHSGPKELSDVLVVVDDTIIIVQSKSLEIDLSEFDDTKFGRIKKRKEQAKRQLNTALNAQQRNAHVSAVTPLGVRFNLDWNRIKHKIGIVTLSLADAAYDDPEFRFQYPELVEEHKGITVHTFLINDLIRMTSELTTPADVLLYLNARAQCVESGKFIIGNELDFLALFKTQYPKIEKALLDSSYHVFIVPGLWEDYKTHQQKKIQDRYYRFQSSIFIDKMIRELRSAVEYSVHQYQLTPQESALNYLSIIGKLNKLTRIERAKIGDMLIKKMEKTKIEKWGYFIYVSEFADTAYLFLILNEDDREQRKVFLHFLCEQACHKVPCSELVGIATDGAKQKENSFDAMAMNVADIRLATKPDIKFQMFKQAEYEKINEWDS